MKIVFDRSRLHLRIKNSIEHAPKKLICTIRCDSCYKYSCLTRRRKQKQSKLSSKQNEVNWCTFRGYKRVGGVKPLQSIFFCVHVEHQALPTRGEIQRNRESACFPREGWRPPLSSVNKPRAFEQSSLAAQHAPPQSEFFLPRHDQSVLRYYTFFSYSLCRS